MDPTADRSAGSSPGAPASPPDPQGSELSRVLGAAAEAGKQTYDQSDPDAQGDIAADDAGGTRLAQDVNRARTQPKAPPGAA